MSNENKTSKREAIVYGVTSFLICFAAFMFINGLMGQSYSEGRRDESSYWEAQNRKLHMENIQLSIEIELMKNGVIK